MIPVDSDLNRNTDCRIRSKSIQAQFMDKFRDVDLPTITDSDGKMVCFNQKYYLLEWRSLMRIIILNWKAIKNILNSFMTFVRNWIIQMGKESLCAR